MKNVTIIIRSVRERTEALCKKLSLDQGLTEEDVFIVREVPFSASLKKSFTIGIEQNRPWTLCIDADILLRAGSLSKMVQYAELQKQNVCEIQGYMMDKFFGGVRRGGIHLYRTSLLSKVLQCIPSEGVDIRPESRTLKRMTEKGYPRVVVPYIVGTHDDEQYNFDIYRKASVQAVKHLDRADLLVSHWRKNMDEDPDFEVALVAFSESIKNTDSLYINSNQEFYKKKFEESGFAEKEELDIDSITLDDIEARVSKWDTDEKYHNYYLNSQRLHNHGKAIFPKIRQSVRKRGTGKTILLAMSQAFLKIGEKLGSRISE